LTDAQGSVRDLLDSTQTLRDHLDYDGYGNATETNSSFGDLYKYTGREDDATTGLQYNRARYYDARMGRWMSQDSLGFHAGDMNLYRYVANMPTGAGDPYGLQQILHGAMHLDRTDANPPNNPPPPATVILRPEPITFGAPTNPNRQGAVNWRVWLSLVGNGWFTRGYLIQHVNRWRFQINLSPRGLTVTFRWINYWEAWEVWGNSVYSPTGGQGKDSFMSTGGTEFSLGFDLVLGSMKYIPGYTLSPSDGWAPGNGTGPFGAHGGGDNPSTPKPPTGWTGSGTTPHQMLDYWNTLLDFPTHVTTVPPAPGPSSVK
jgi:RHS repeat-associated protein